VSTETAVKSVEVNATNVSSTTSGRGKSFVGKSVQRLCYCCNSEKHAIAHCPHKQPGVRYGPTNVPRTQYTGNASITNSAAIGSNSGVAARSEANACNVIGERCIDPCIAVDCVSAERVRKPEFVKSQLQYVDVVING
jgi:hypothetical protein